MNTDEVNKALAAGDVSTVGVLPKLDELNEAPAVFTVPFGLSELPQTSGILLVRGARQYGKSTWMQQQIKETIRHFGPGTVYHLNAEEFPNADSLGRQIKSLAGLYSMDAPVKRLFIDEITAINGWEKTIKTLADAGELRDILLVTTGSSAAELRHGAERLPGRKGQLARTYYIFPPISFREFCRVFESELPSQQLVPAYILTGGAPPACNALLSFGYIPDYIIELVRDWIYGEFAGTGRSRGTLVSLFECFYRFAGTPVGQSKLARETGLANNSVAAGYLDLLADLLSVAFAYPWDASRKRLARRRPCKFHLTNLLAATALHPHHPRTPADILALPEEQYGSLLEWLTAQEIWRRRAIAGHDMAEIMGFWQGSGHEIDFVLDGERFLEVKRGSPSPLDFQWFRHVFPERSLEVISEATFETDRVRSITMADFLMEK